MITSSLRYLLYARKSSESEDRQVASIPSQIDELTVLAKQLNLRVIDTLKEEKSAKAPGRPVFNQMLQDISDGKADAILCWKLDRLARNPVDGGNLQWLLQKGIIKHIRAYSGSYSPSDNVMLMSVEFGMANQFILDLSVNTKRGMKAKAHLGWIPHKPPIGYYNKPDSDDPERPSTIDKDSASFPLMLQLWKMLLQKKCTILKLYDVAQSMGLTTHKGKTISRTNFYRLFQNPFYYGYFYWHGELYHGKHEPMISKAEFDQAQAIMHNRSFPRAKTHTFAFTGLIRCGECKAGITAEEKTKHQKNGNSHHYTYYRCTKRINPNCSQKPIRQEELEEQILNILGKIHIPPSFHQWAIKQLKTEHEREKYTQQEVFQAHRKRLDTVNNKLNTLLEMRMNSEITQEEYQTKKDSLLKEQHKFEELLKDANQRIVTWLDRAETMFNFAETAQKRFTEGSLETKRDILSCLGSNLTLQDRKLDISLDKGLSMLLQVAPEIQNLHNRLEPAQSIGSKADWEVLYSQNKKWGP